MRSEVRNKKQSFVCACFPDRVRSRELTDAYCGGTNCQCVGSEADADCSDRVASTEYEVAKSTRGRIALGRDYGNQADGSPK